ncbi:MAG: dockerin type I repeat-containing protein, partial [Muribaculaceae bacterium]|nr:dockerin type I repeat-containing protein [Muribaculaceae bacterium]
VPGIYRIALSKIENLQTGADVEGNENLRISDCELIDDSPIKVEGAEDSGELANVAQINSDGEYIYWSYIAPASDGEAIRNSVPLDPSNPLHKSGIKCLRAKANEDGTMSTSVGFAIEGVEAYGVCGATYTDPDIPGPTPLKGDVNGDGEVNIADVNALIDIILKGTSGNPSADVNGDGEVNIADVNSIIDIILTA